MPRLDEKLKERLTEDDRSMFWSLEFFPPKTHAGVANLYDRIERLSMLKPLFCGVTWGANGSTAELSTDICIATQNILGLETLMHITCHNVGIETIDKALKAAYDKGIQNLFCLRGNVTDGAEVQCDNNLPYATDFVKYVREKYEDYFCIVVAGYPDGHSEGTYQQDLVYLKEKVTAGADIIITQSTYNADSFLNFQKDCRDMGITIPILPGLMPLNTHHQYQRAYHRNEPEELRAIIEKCSNDDEALKQEGVAYLCKLIERLHKGGVRGFHLFSLNLEWSVTRIVDELGLVEDSLRRDFPWRQSANPNRAQMEEVRPIFWSNRPKSYLARTMRWDDFPNGRWGDSRSPAFGEVDHHHKSLLLATTRMSVAALLACPTTVADVVALFVNYLQGKVGALPWFESPLALESCQILDSLVRVNHLGCLTINSQPMVNGVSSEDKEVGWGPPHGYVYQKEYVEFFCHPDAADVLRNLLVTDFPLISYMMADRQGKYEFSNVEKPIAVTWGVFPGSEIQQPTVVDPFSFGIWKDEAFSLWLAPYVGRDIPPLIRDIHDTWVLVNFVHNDYIQGNLWDMFDRASHQAKWPSPGKVIGPPLKKRPSLTDLLAQYLDPQELKQSETAREAAQASTTLGEDTPPPW